MGQKGITPIVATILLLLLAIFIGSIIWVFFKGTITEALIALRGAEKKVVEKGKAQLTIESISEGKIYIRNVGTIKLSDFTLYIDGKLINSSSPPSLEPNQPGVINILENIGLGYHFVRITTAEGAEDQVYKSFQFIFTGLSITSFTLNDTSLTPGGSVRINATVINQSAIDKVWARITYPDTSTTDKSMSRLDSKYTVTFNDTSQIGTYNVRVYANDTLGNLASSTTKSFEVIGVDTNPPTITDEGVSDTQIIQGGTVKLNATVTDDTAVGTVKFYVKTPVGNYNITAIANGDEYYVICNSTNICNTNNLGSFNWTSTWANDTSNNIATSSPNLQFNVSLADTIPPTYSNDADDSGGSVTAGTIVNVAVKWDDNVGLSKAVLRTNKTGSWVNESWHSFTTTPEWFNTTIDTTGYAGTRICWVQWANDTSNNWNKSMTPHCFNVTAGVVSSSTKPSYNGVLTVAGNRYDCGYTVSKTNTQNCDGGNCNPDLVSCVDVTRAWPAGEETTDGSYSTQIDWYFNVSDLGITGTDIINLTVKGGGCWGGDTAAGSIDCVYSDPAELASDTPLNIFIYNWDTTEYDYIGNVTIPAEGNTIDGLYSDEYRIYEVSKTSGFVSGHVYNGIIKIRYDLRGSGTVGQDVIGVYDFAFLTIYYYS